MALWLAVWMTVAIFVGCQRAAGTFPGNGDTDMAEGTDQEGSDSTDEWDSPEDRDGETILDAEASEGGKAALLALEAESTFTLPGLAAPVVVLTDPWGIPHIHAADAADAVRAVGYLQAELRMFQLDAARKAARGRMTELVGGAAAAYDLERRALLTRLEGGDVIEAIWADLAPDTRDLLRAFAEGVNARLQRYRADPSDWPRIYGDAIVAQRPHQVADWEPQDTIAIARLQAWFLSDASNEELQLAVLREALPDAVFREIVFDRPLLPWSVADSADSAYSEAPQQRHPFGTPLIPPLPENPQARLLDFDPRIMGEFTAARRERNRHFSMGLQGAHSNNWVVAPTAERPGFLCNDPHLELTTPSVFIPMSVDTTLLGEKGRTLAGAGVFFPGTPAVILGRNRFVAWAGTVAGYDVGDVYIEKVSFDSRSGEPVSTLYRGEQIPLRKIPVRLRKGRSEPPQYIDRAIYIVPHHGPLLPDSIDKAWGRAVSLRWTGANPTFEVEAIHRLNLATNLMEAKAAFDRFGVGAQNWLIATTTGDVAWFPRAVVPRRTGNLRTHRPDMALDGSTGDVEWDGIVPISELPARENPPSGRIVTANNDLSGALGRGNPFDSDSYLQGLVHVADGWRAKRISDELARMMGELPPPWKSSEATEVPLAEAMAKLQTDTHSLFAKRTVIALLAAVDSAGIADRLSASAQAGLALLRTWDGDLVSGLPPGALPTADPVADPGERAHAAATTFFHFLVVRLSHEILADEMKAAGLDNQWIPDPFVTGLVPHLLEQVGQGQVSPLWDDNTTAMVDSPGAILKRALERTVTDMAAHPALAERMGSALDVAAALWGRVHTLTFAHPLSSALLDDWSEGPFATGGGIHTVNVAAYGSRMWPDAQRYAWNHGPSMRMVHAFGPSGFTTDFSFPGRLDERHSPVGGNEPEGGGMMEHADDPRYGNALRDTWMRGSMVRLALDWNELKALGVPLRVMRLEP